jgi:hypothetical protein
MRSDEFIHTNSLGKPIRNYDNFIAWFGNSVAVDSKNRPLVVYHGTGASFDEFSLDYRGEDKGNDQYGPGFYVATDSSAASQYAYGESPNVIPLYVSIQKPVIHGITKPVSTRIIRELITKSPNFEDSILNFGDVSYEGMNKVLNRAVNAYTVYENLMQQIMTIMGDFWSGISPINYLAYVTKLTKYDGVIVKLPNNVKFFVAWSKNQLKSAVGNNGNYSRSSNSIVSEKYL